LFFCNEILNYKEKLNLQVIKGIANKTIYSFEKDIHDILHEYIAEDKKSGFAF
jgi:hypothetical protein